MSSITLRIWVVVFGIIILPQALLAVGSSPPFTLEMALRQAVASSPSISAAYQQARAAKARVYETLGGMLPQITAGAGYQRLTANFVASPGSVPSSFTHQEVTSNNNTFNFLTLQATATQLLYDFEQTHGRLQAARASAVALDHNIHVTALTVDLAVRSNYLLARLQQQLSEVQEQTLNNEKMHLQQAQAFLAQNTNTPVDVAQALANVAVTEANLLATVGNVQLAKVDLVQSMGLHPNIYDGFELVVGNQEDIPKLSGEESDIAQLLAEAYAARPDFHMLQAQQKSLKHTLTAVWGALGPTFSAQAIVTDRGQSPNALAYNWQIALNVNWPLFAGTTPFAGIVEARANLAAVKAQLENCAIMVQHDVIHSWQLVAVSKAALKASLQALQASQERLHLTEQRFAAQLSGMIELSDAQLAVTTQSAQVAQNRYQLQLGRAQLLYALGRRE